MKAEASEKRLQLKVGLFVVAAIVAALGVVMLLGKKRHVFEGRTTLHAKFADVAGLRVGAPVWLSGVNVGTVTQISFGPLEDKKVRVNLEIARKMLTRVRRDSVARIDSQGLLGDKIVEISIGTPDSPEIEPGGEITTVPPADIGQMMAQAGEILEKIKVVADDAAQMAHALADPKTVAGFRGSLESIRTLLKQVERGPGLAHALFYDGKTEKDLQHLASELNRLVAHVDQGVKRIDSILDATDADGKQVVNNLSRAARSVDATAAEIKRSKVIPNLERASADVADVAAHVRSGQGTIGALLVDPTVYEQLVTVLGGVGRSRVLRALVRYAIARDPEKTTARVVDEPKQPPPPPTIVKSKKDRASR